MQCRIRGCGCIMPKTSASSAVRSIICFCIALNIARDRLVSERRYLTAVQIEEMLDLADDSADPASLAESRSSCSLSSD